MKSIIFHIAFPVRLTWELISLGGLAVGAARREAGSHLQWFGLRGTSRGEGHVAYPTAAWNRLQQVLTTHQPDIQSPWKHTLKLYTIQQINKTNLHITHIKLIRFNFNFLFTRTLHNDTNHQRKHANCVFITCWRVLRSETKQLLYHTVMKFVNMLFEVLQQPFNRVFSLSRK